MTDLKKATGEEVIVHVPPGSAKHVKVVESDPKTRGKAVGIITK